MFNKLICNTECESYFNNFFNSLEEGILFSEAGYDENGEVMTFVIIDTNKAFERVFRTTREDIIGKTINEVYPGIASKCVDIYNHMVSSGSSSQSDVHFKIEDKHFKVNITSPIKGHIITSFNDITNQIKADEILKKHFLLFENAHDILLYLKSDGSIIDANKTAVNKYGYTYGELLNMNIQQLRHTSMIAEYNEQMEASASQGIVFEGVHVKKDGTSFPIEVSSRSIDVNGELLRIHIIRDITDRKKAEEKIRYLANYDALTGIPNRGFLMSQFENTLELSAKDNLKFSVMLFDIDKFKAINDLHGHNAGDQVLRTVAQRLKKAAGECHMVGRLGGDEFFIIQSTIDSKEEVSTLSEKILEAVCKPVKLGSVDLDISISLGAAMYPETSQSKEGLIQCADTAMYEVKQKGGRAYNIYSK